MRGPSFAVLSLALVLGGCLPGAEAREKSVRGEAPPPRSFPRTTIESGLAAGDSGEVHGITTYFGGHIPVFVRPTGKPLILHLASFDAAVWHLYLFPDAQVKAVHLAGFEPQRLVIHRARESDESIGPRVFAEWTSLMSHETLSFGPPIGHNEPSDAPKVFPGYLAMVKETTGAELTHFQGRKYFAPGQAVAIPAGDPPSDALIAQHFRVPDSKRALRPDLDDFERARSDIEQLVEAGKVPASLPLYNNALKLAPGEGGSWSPLPAAAPTTHRPRHRDQCGEIQAGTRSDDALNCDAGKAYAARTRWLLGGGGRDILTDHSTRSQVMSGGRGDDIIIADLGNDILHFGADWGDDIVDMRCRPDDIFHYYGDAETRQAAFQREPAHMHSRLLVFGKGVRPEDLEWRDANLLVDTRTGARIHFSDGFCARMVAVEAGKLPEPPLPEGRPRLMMSAPTAVLPPAPIAKPAVTVHRGSQPPFSTDPVAAPH